MKNNTSGLGIILKRLMAVTVAVLLAFSFASCKNDEEKYIKSPLVGRFYVAPSENDAPFVREGDAVKKGQIVAIVEAMKLMNDIESDFDGIIEEVLVENGDTVEYGQKLFRVK